MNFFIWLFFVFGVIAIILGLIPTILSVAVVIINICKTFALALKDDLEVRQAKMKARKEARLKKIEDEVVVKDDEQVEETPIEETTPVEIITDAE